MTMTNFIAGLPAPVRHFAAVVIATFVLFVAGAVSAAGGVFDVAWLEVGKAGVDAAAVGGAGVLVLYVTPLTDAYGVGKAEPKVIVLNADEEDVDEDELPGGELS